jgi:hypothetical protein
MSMIVETTVHEKLIARLLITNETERPTGENTYRWIYSRHDLGGVNALLSAQEGTLQHVMEDGSMVLLAKVAMAASQTEVSAG